MVISWLILDGSARLCTVELDHAHNLGRGSE